MRMKRRSIICILVAALMTVMSLWHVAYADDLQDQMDEVKENSKGDIYVVTCFSDRMKFLDRR